VSFHRSFDLLKSDDVLLEAQIVHFPDPLGADGGAPLHDSSGAGMVSYLFILTEAKVFPDGDLGILQGENANSVSQFWIPLILFFKTHLDVLTDVQVFIVIEIQVTPSYLASVKPK
jgi:hypothetical protein